MKIVILTGHTSSSVHGGFVRGEGEDPPDDYMHGEHGQELLADADVVVAIWPPSKRPIIMRAPEGVEVQALDKAHMGRAKLHDGITEDEDRQRMADELRLRRA